MRQGDPLSPYIFLFWVKGLFAFLKKFMEEGLLKGVATCPKGPTISRLFFADDSLILFQAMREDYTSLENVLETYE